MVDSWMNLGQVVQSLNSDAGLHQTHRVSMSKWLVGASPQPLGLVSRRWGWISALFLFLGWSPCVVGNLPSVCRNPDQIT